MGHPVRGRPKFITEENPETETAGDWFNSVTSLSSIIRPIAGGFIAAVSHYLTFKVVAMSAVVALGVYLYALRSVRESKAGA